MEAGAAQGVTRIAATPHFYAEENSTSEFLERREASVSLLKQVWHPGLPELRLGAEVCWFEGISQTEGLEALRIEGTRLLLLEMPFAPWRERQLREVWMLQARPEITVVLAHIERYLHWQEKEVWDMLADWGVLNQCNASFFLLRKTRRKALRMLREGRVHLLGSDCHNMEQRPPQLGKAMALFREEERRQLLAYEEELLSQWEAYRA